MRSHRSLSILLASAVLTLLAATGASAATAPVAVAQPAVVAAAHCAAPSAAVSTAPTWSPAAVATPVAASSPAADPTFGFVNPSFCPPQCGECGPGERCTTPCHFQSGCRICSCV